MQVKLMPPYCGNDEAVKSYSVLSDGKSHMLIIQHIFSAIGTVIEKEEATYVTCGYGNCRQTFRINGVKGLDVFTRVNTVETRVLFCNTAAYLPV
jgi:hypothetical protein